MNAPLYSSLVSFSRTKKPFHMPGHKLGRGADLSDLDLLAIDNTEALGLDNLYVAEGIIKEALDLMSKFYKSQDTIFLTNGSTSGILASILAVCKDGDKLIVSRNAHHSVWSALVLAGVTPIYVSPEHKEEYGILGEMNPQTIADALHRYPDIKGAIIVSPTYEGIVSQVRDIADILHKENKVLIVDEAHGAHFNISTEFPTSSIELGADLVINSTHKTLPALTQSGLIHICSDRVSYDDVISSLRMVQTSSPSYMMMGVMDYIRDYIETNNKIINDGYITTLKKMRTTLRDNLKTLKLLDYNKDIYDYSKIIIFTDSSAVTGYELEKLLNDKYDITVEASLDKYIILMTTMADSKDGLEYLTKSLIEIDTHLSQKYNNNQIYRHITRNNNMSIDIKTDINNNEVIAIKNIKSSAVVQGLSPRVIYNTEKKWIRIDEANEKVSAENIMLYPPGVPLICIGETISKDSISMIKLLKDKMQGIKVIDNIVYVYVVK